LQPRLEDNVRRQILADMGIDIWRVRVGPAAAGDHVTAVNAAALAEPLAGTGPERAQQPARRASPAPAAVPDRKPDPANAAAPAPRRTRAAAPVDPAVAPFSILAASLDGVTLLMEGRPDRRAARLVRDLLSAAAGQWSAQPVTRQFDWPPAVGLPELSADDVSGRALLAFVDKTLTDHATWLVLVVGAAATRLPVLAPRLARLALPDLKTLGQDPAAKRQVWAAIGRLRTDARRRGTAAAAEPPPAEPPT